MQPLYQCKCCGFLSTRGDAFTSLHGLRVDNDCKKRYEMGLEPHKTWIKELLKDKLETTETQR